MTLRPCRSCGTFRADGPCPHCGASALPVGGTTSAVLLLGLTLGAFQCVGKGEEPPYGVPATDTGEETGDTGETTPE